MDGRPGLATAAFPQIYVADLAVETAVATDLNSTVGSEVVVAEAITLESEVFFRGSYPLEVFVEAPRDAKGQPSLDVTIVTGTVSVVSAPGPRARWAWSAWRVLT